MVALPGQLFYSTQIPACLWFLARSKNPGGNWRDRRGEVLFIDARKLGHMVDRTRKEFSDADIARIVDTYRAWRGALDASPYEDEPWFCKSVTLEETREHNDVLTPGRYVGAPPQEDDGEPFEDKMTRLVAELQKQQAEGARLDAVIAENVKAWFAGLAGALSMSIDTTFLRRCIVSLERAVPEIERMDDREDVLYDIYRVACVKESSCSNRATSCCASGLSPTSPATARRTVSTSRTCSAMPPDTTLSTAKP